MTITVAHLFQTPIVIDALPDAAKHNVALDRAIARSLPSPPSNLMAERVSIDGFPDDATADAALGAVRAHAVALAMRYTRDTRSSGRASLPWTVRVWATSAAGEMVPELRCYDAFWVADYFVSDGYAGRPADGQGGEWVIDDPRLPSPMAEEPRLRLRPSLDVGAPRYEPEIRIRPGSGKMLMYPGWLRPRRAPSTARSLWLTIVLTAPVS